VLNANIGADAFDLIPVFWGDLGARSANLGDALPQVPARRAEGDAEETSRLLFGTEFDSSPGQPTRRAGTPAEVVAEAAVESLQGAGARRGEDPDEVREAIREAWGNTQWLLRLR